MSRNETVDEISPASNWTGWVSFAGMMLCIGGGFHVIEGLATLLDGDDHYQVTRDGLAVDVSFTVLGWTQIGLGLLAFVIGVGLLRGVMVARVAGVLLAAASAIVHLAAIAAHPLWSTVIIVFNVVVIYAIVVHGREMKKLW